MKKNYSTYKYNYEIVLSTSGNPIILWLFINGMENGKMEKVFLYIEDYASIT